MSSKPAIIHDKPLPQEFDDCKTSASHRDVSHLDELEVGQYDDFDAVVSHYQPPCSFKEFLIKPFSWMDSRTSVLCKTGQFKLPKEIINLYVTWNFENYHYVELAALLYLHYYRDCDEWQDNDVLKNEIDEILEALPHFKTVEELFTYAFINGDLKLGDFDQVIEVDDSGASDVTHLAED